jgi:hypothetical protein
MVGPAAGQLGEIRRDPSSLILAQQLGGRARHTNSKAAEPGRPTALRRLSNRLGGETPTLYPLHASKKDEGPVRPEKHKLGAVHLKRSFCVGGT